MMPETTSRSRREFISGNLNSGPACEWRCVGAEWLGTGNTTCDVRKHQLWLGFKLAFCVYSLCGTAFLQFDLTRDEVPPYWIACAVFPVTFAQGLLLRFSGEKRLWTEKELWLASPFIRSFRRMAYYVPFYHLGAVSFIVMGIGYGIAAFIQQRPFSGGVGCSSRKYGRRNVAWPSDASKTPGLTS